MPDEDGWMSLGEFRAKVKKGELTFREGPVKFAHAEAIQQDRLREINKLRRVIDRDAHMCFCEHDDGHGIELSLNLHNGNQSFCESCVITWSDVYVFSESELLAYADRKRKDLRSELAGFLYAEGYRAEDFE